MEMEKMKYITYSDEGRAADGTTKLTINFMLPVPDASVPAVEICCDRSAAGKIFSANETR